MKYRVVAYGDSIYAGYNGSAFNAAKHASPTVDAEYLSAAWNADIAYGSAFGEYYTFGLKAYLTTFAL